MKNRDIVEAVSANDIFQIRRGFRALVDYPHEEPVETGAPGHLLVSLTRCCDALRGDLGIMPRETCDALDLDVGANYGQGAVAARGPMSQKLTRRIVDNFR